MSDMLKRGCEIALLRLELLPRTGGDRILFEIELTGDPGQRELVSTYGEALAEVPLPNGLHAELPRVGVICRFTLSVRELGLPSAGDAATFRPPSFLKRSAAALEHTAGGALRRIVSRLASEWRADDLGRRARETSWIPAPEASLPTWAARQLRAALATVLRPGEPLWLELLDPSGFLATIPWEQYLDDVTSAPMLRLSPHALQPVTSRGELVVVLCASLPDPGMLPGTTRLARLLSAIHAQLPPGSTLHLFADAALHARFGAAMAKVGNGVAMHLHPVPEATVDGLASTQSAPDDPRRVHPWVTWITTRIGGQAVDIVHWLALGVTGEEGLLVATDPAVGGTKATLEERSFRFVPVVALTEFLTRVGAWGAVFTSPEAASVDGLRLTADGVARVRPGVSALHSLADDPQGTSIGSLYRFLITPASPPDGLGHDAVVYSHPALAGAAPDIPPPIETDTCEMRVISAYREVAQSAERIIAQAGPTPDWVAATQRVAEQSASRLMTSGSLRQSDATARGVSDALELLKHVLDRRQPPHSTEGVRMDPPRVIDNA